MLSSRHRHGHRPATVVAVLAAAVAFVVLGAGPASAVGPGNYSIVANTGSTFQLLTGNNLISAPTDDTTILLSTTTSGRQHLPFPLHFYNATYRTVSVSSNGNVQFTSSGNAAFTNDCLPSATIFAPMAAAFWDDLFFNPQDTSHFFREGIFTRTQGSAPHRKFTISWQGHRFGETDFVLAQANFFEGVQNVVFIYGANGGQGATVGVQSSNGFHSTQWTCNGTGLANGVSSGLRLRFQHSG